MPEKQVMLLIKGIEATNPVIQNLRKAVNEIFANHPLETYHASAPLASPAAGAAVESELNNEPLAKQKAPEKKRQIKTVAVDP